MTLWDISKSPPLTLPHLYMLSPFIFIQPHSSAFCSSTPIPACSPVSALPAPTSPSFMQSRGREGPTKMDRDQTSGQQ